MATTGSSIAVIPALVAEMWRSATTTSAIPSATSRARSPSRARSELGRVTAAISASPTTAPAQRTSVSSPDPIPGPRDDLRHRSVDGEQRRRNRGHEVPERRARLDHCAKVHKVVCARRGVAQPG